MLLACLAALGSARAADSAAPQVVSAARGNALFDGAEPLAGRIRGHADPMPAGVLVCATCHVARAPQPAAEGDVPVLNGTSLLAPRSRRYGPPSAYSLETFCRVLRTGVDPVHIMLSRTMPLFAPDTAQCESLWLYLKDRKPA